VRDIKEIAVWENADQLLYNYEHDKNIGTPVVTMTANSLENIYNLFCS